MPPPEMEEGAKLDKDVNVDKADIGTSKRPAFDLLNFAANGTLVLGVAGLLWLAIENVDDDVDQLAATVQTLAGDVGYIKGRLESIPIASHVPVEIESPLLVSHLTSDDATFP